MNVLVWVREGVWPAAVDAARELAGRDDAVTLVHVLDPAIAAGAHAAYAGLLGRGGWPNRGRRDPGEAVEAAGQAAESDLMAAARDRLGRPAETVFLRGRVEHEVVAACTGMDVLVVARDGDTHRAGPKSLGPAGRFVVDHAPCRVLLVWPADEV
ncbi:universal stress protein [Actinoplanes sp. HUAS TT8]|uniref:universal stress protein n=1 Tax=Actinoplanes sp. HUAS TT8 TaxID=3447453 RepID=UPI003F52144B